MPATRAADCPRERLIVDFSRGKLDEATTVSVAAHLETCVDCRSAVDRVAADSFMLRLRAAHAQSSAAENRRGLAPFAESAEQKVPVPLSADGSPPASLADSVSRANSGTVTFKPSAPQDSPSEAAKFSVPPELVDHSDYEVVKELGRGGMGVVYLARNRSMDRLEVLKVVSRSLLEQPGARERFQREIRSAAKLSHSNIVAAYSVPRAGDLLIFAMEYVEGQDLSQIVKQRGPLPVINAAYYAHQAALGLQHAHEQKMIHRDIKPGNLILSVQGRRHLVKILDFGLAKASSEKLSSSELTGSGQMLGTPDYMAPEQSLDAHQADIRADIYSLGCTLYYLLAGRPPFEGPSMYAVLADHHSATARPLSEVRADVPAELAAVVARMMSKQPADRYQTPAEVSQALGPFFRAKGTEAAKLAPLPDVKSPVAAALNRGTGSEQPSDPADDPALPRGACPPFQPAAFDPYYEWLGIAPEERPVDYYRLLGVKQFEANFEVIENLADQRLAHLDTFQNGQHAPLAQRLLKEISAARDCLLAADKKAAYDAQLRRSIPAQPQPMPPAAAPTHETVVPPQQHRNKPGVRAFLAARASWAVALCDRCRAAIPPRFRTRGWLAAAAAAAFAGVVALGVLFTMRTSEGTLVVQLSDPDATVEVLDDQGKLLIQQKAGAEQIELSVVPGKGKLRVVKNGVELIAKEFSLLSGGREIINARLERPAGGAAPPLATEPLATLNDHAFQQWMKGVAALPAEQQVVAVSKKLQELNPGFDGKLGLDVRGDGVPKVERGVVTELGFVTDNVTDISPVRALAGLMVLHCTGSSSQRGNLSDLSPLQGMRLTTLDCGFTKVSDLSPLKGMPLTWLSCFNTAVSDLSPLKGVRLMWLWCQATQVSDLSPLKGMPLRGLLCSGTRVFDLSPLEGMRLQSLRCDRTAVSDLSPLKGMPLDDLYCDQTRVSDLSPLEGMPLRTLDCRRAPVSDLSPLKGVPLADLQIENTQVSDLSPLKGMELTSVLFTPRNITKGLDAVRQMKSLTTIGMGFQDSEQFPPAEFWKKYDAGDFGKPDSPASVADHTPRAALNDPAFQQWMKGVAALPAQQQLEAVSKKLQELNPGFDGKEAHEINNGAVTELHFSADSVTDISPVRALLGLKRLDCAGSDDGKGILSDLSPLAGMHLTVLGCWKNSRLSDLSPLSGMPLTELYCDKTAVADLKPLKGMSLTQLHCGNTLVSDLSPLQGMPLTLLWCERTPVRDLSPLKGMALSNLLCWSTGVSDLSPLAGMQLVFLGCGGGTGVSDLSPLKGMPLASLWCDDTRVSDLSPLKGMPLAGLRCYATRVSDLSPLRGMQLTLFLFTPRNITKGLDAIREMKSLTEVGEAWPSRMPPTEFWKKYDAGKFGKPDAPAPASGHSAAATLSDRAFQQWMKAVAAMPAEEQVKAVTKKLQELNPGFDRKETHEIDHGVVTVLQFFTDNVTDISPVRALGGLKSLVCRGSTAGKGISRDLSPLQGMRLTKLDCGFSKVFDLSPLKGMPLIWLSCWDTQVSDISMLQGMPLTFLSCGCSHVSDLSPLKGMRLTNLGCSLSPVSDLSPLKGMPLEVLFCAGTKVSDLSPLRGMPLRQLDCGNSLVSDLTPLNSMPLRVLTCEQTPVSDVSPLKGMSLTMIYFTPSNIAKGLDVVRRMKSLEKIGLGWGGRPDFLPEEFWKKFDAGEFK